MIDRAACERRVYRLATLLTGNPVAATAVVQQVVDAQPDLRQVDSAHLDRLTVLRSREIAAGRIVDDRVADRFAEALASLKRQQREAWIFVRVYRMPIRAAARAMDCSYTAAGRHLELADSAMGGVDGSAPGSAAEALLQYSLSLDVPGFFKAARRRRRRTRRLLQVAAALVVVGALLVFLRWLLAPG